MWGRPKRESVVNKTLREQLVRSHQEKSFHPPTQLSLKESLTIRKIDVFTQKDLYEGRNSVTHGGSSIISASIQKNVCLSNRGSTARGGG